MALETLSDLMQDELKDLYSAESQMLKALPKMARKASSTSLKDAFTRHVTRTEEQLKRLETIGEDLGIKLSGKKCKAMEGLLAEGNEFLEEKGASPVIDAALIGAAQRVEHYEIAAYGTIRTLAEVLGHQDAVKLLQETLDEEGETDTELTAIAEQEVLIEARGQA